MFSTYAQQMGLYRKVDYRNRHKKIFRVLREAWPVSPHKIPCEIGGILGPRLAPKTSGVVASRIRNGGSNPTIAYRTHLAKDPPELPMVRAEHCSLSLSLSLSQCCMLGTSGTCEAKFRTCCAVRCSTLTSMSQ